MIWSYNGQVQELVERRARTSAEVAKRNLAESIPGILASQSSVGRLFSGSTITIITNEACAQMENFGNSYKTAIASFIDSGKLKFWSDNIVSDFTLELKVLEVDLEQMITTEKVTTSLVKQGIKEEMLKNLIATKLRKKRFEIIDEFSIDCEISMKKFPLVSKFISTGLGTLKKIQFGR